MFDKGDKFFKFPIGEGAVGGFMYQNTQPVFEPGMLHGGPVTLPWAHLKDCAALMQLMAGCIAAKVGMAAPFEILPNPEMRSYWALDVNLKIHWRNPKLMCIDRPSKNKSEK
jgi:hypothetical protein